MIIQDASRVYVIHNKEFNIVKIGVAANPQDRIKTLEASSGCVLNVAYRSRPLINAFEIEKLCHKALFGQKRKGEWFDCSVDLAIYTIESHKDLYIYNYIVEEYLKGVTLTAISSVVGISRQAIAKKLKACDVYTDSIPSDSIEPEVIHGPVMIPTGPKVMEYLDLGNELSQSPDKGKYKRISPNLYLDKDTGIYMTQVYFKGNIHKSYFMDVNQALASIPKL